MVAYLKSGLFALLTLLLLAACSSQPSPWSQSSSPWANKDTQEEQVTDEENAVAADDQSGFVEPVEPDAFSAVEPLEPIAPIDPVVAEPVVPEVNVAQSEASAAEVPVVESEVVSGNLRSQPAKYFAVQVCASRSTKQLAAFAKRNKLSDQWMAQTSVKGETWFVLLEGVYATRAEARDALSRVRSQVDTSPWIRTIGSLQAVMQ